MEIEMEVEEVMMMEIMTAAKYVIEDLHRLNKPLSPSMYLIKKLETYEEALWIACNKIKKLHLELTN
jgi:hypothetical protein